MAGREDARDLQALFLSDVPLIDVRAPVEFAKGAFPLASNLPLMNDLERQRVGTRYKQQGQQAALQLGHQLVSGAVKAERIQAWADFARAHPDGYLYCFRGGLRSQLSQEWLRSEGGIAYPRVVGGYKAMRTFLIETLQQALAECRFVVVGGMTGTGKTEVVAQLANAIDLEGHANHRGSSFGKRATPQPGQIDFENRLAIDLLRRRHAGQTLFVLEDESRLVGRCSLPLELHQAMQQFPLVWLEDSRESRVERILRDYVIDLAAEFVSLHGQEQGFALFAEQLRKSLAGIAKRLGGERFQRLSAILEVALAEQERSGEVAAHRGWIEGLLAEYYDPMYAYQRESKASRVVFSGDQAAVVDYLRRAR
ncbi:MAG: tRNA 2-selenouridine(34) synthase MnmH [Pseudomonas oryzihabitans]